MTRQINQVGFRELNYAPINGGNTGRILAAQFGRTPATRLVSPIGNSHYDSLQTSLERRFAAGMQLCLAAPGQTDFSIQPKMPAQQGNGWKLPKVKLLEPLKAAQLRSGAPRNDLRNNSTALRPNAAIRACGHIIVIKPANPGVDSKMVIQPPKRTSNMPMLGGLPACSELK